MQLNDELKKDVELILNTFGGDDNATFMAYKILLEDLDQRQDNASKELVAVTQRFARFLRVARKTVYKDI